MCRVRQILIPTHGLDLVNSMIDKKESKKELVAWKKMNSHENNYITNIGCVGLGYGNNFMKRNKSKIWSTHDQI